MSKEDERDKFSLQNLFSPVPMKTVLLILVTVIAVLIILATSIGVICHIQCRVSRNSSLVQCPHSSHLVQVVGDLAPGRVSTGTSPLSENRMASLSLVDAGHNPDIIHHTSAGQWLSGSVEEIIITIN